MRSHYVLGVDVRHHLRIHQRDDTLQVPALDRFVGPHGLQDFVGELVHKRFRALRLRHCRGGRSTEHKGEP